MTYSLAKGSFDQLLDRFENALAWLAKNNVRISESRIEQYRQDVQSIVHARKDNTLDDLVSNNRFPRLLNSVHEVYRIIAYSEGLINCVPTPAFISRLKKSVTGPLFASDEALGDGSHHGRDFAFELTVASQFVRANYEWDPSSTTDVLVSDPPIHFRIECKRPASDKSVRTSVRKAITQLKNTLKPSTEADTTYGLIALSVDKVVIPKGKFLHAKDNPAVAELLAADLVRFANKYRQHWKDPKHPRIIGVLLFIQTACIIQSENVPVSAMFINFVPLITERSLSYSALESMYRRLMFVTST